MTTFALLGALKLPSKISCHLLESTLGETKWRGHLEKRGPRIHEDREKDPDSTSQPNSAFSDFHGYHERSGEIMVLFKGTISQVCAITHSVDS